MKEATFKEVLLPSQIRWGLAPMEGVTDFAMRLWFALTAPPQFMWTPFLRVTDTFPAKLPPHFVPELTILKGCVPYQLIPQLMGPRVEDFTRTCELLLPYAEFVDLNCGCPSPTVVGNRSGSSLLERADYFGSFIERAAKVCGANRMSVKMRTGYHHSHEFKSLLSAISGIDLAQLTIHGRTRPQRYTGSSDWSLIESASKSLSFRVVGSGDVVSGTSAESLSRVAPSVKTMIIGRGALRHPWIFGSESDVPLIGPLFVFALLQEISLNEPERLVKFAAEGGVLTPAAANVDAWRTKAEQLMPHIQSSVSTDLVVSPRAFARVKMLWSYLRSSLPAPFMEPTILRTKSLSEFFCLLQKITAAHELSLDSLPLMHQAQHDWMYSGQGRGESPRSPSVD